MLVECCSALLMNHRPTSAAALQSHTELLRKQGRPFAVATVVRTVSISAAKAGAKAIIDDSGEIIAGWIGGGCARSAVLNAAKECIAAGQTRLISIQPQDLLAEQGLQSGSEHSGTHYTSNHCPSQGTMDIFVEPEIPAPVLHIIGDTPVAVALAELAPGFNFNCIRQFQSEITTELPPILTAGYRQFTVVATQGSGDLAALQEALHSGAEYVAFIGSRKKNGSAKVKDRAAGYNR